MLVILFSYKQFVSYRIFFYLCCSVASDTQSMLSDETNLSADGQDSPPDMDSASGTSDIHSTIRLMQVLYLVI
jgi:hypothetical protein